MRESGRGLEFMFATAAGERDRQTDRQTDRVTETDRERHRESRQTSYTVSVIVEWQQMLLFFQEVHRT